MARIENLQSLQRKLRGLMTKYVGRDRGKGVVVGYTAAYMVYVHENKAAHHNVGEAKFLETPARELGNSGVLAKIVVNAVKKGATLIQGLLMAGLRLQRESQKRCPVDTGNLRGSAFTRIE